MTEPNAQPTQPAGTGPTAPAMIEPSWPPSGATQPSLPAAPLGDGGRSLRRRTLLDIVLVVAVAFAIGGVGFALGRVSAPATQAAAGLSGNFRGGGQLPGAGQLPGGGQLPGAAQGRGGFAGGGIALRGEVVDVAADHLTLELESGQTVQIALDTSTTYHRQAAATSGDVTRGSQVVVQLTPRGAGTGTPGSGTDGLRLGGASDVTVVAP